MEVVAHRSATQGLAALPRIGNFNSTASASRCRSHAAEFVSTATLFGTAAESWSCWPAGRRAVISNCDVEPMLINPATACRTKGRDDVHRR